MNESFLVRQEVNYVVTHFRLFVNLTISKKRKIFTWLEIINLFTLVEVAKMIQYAGKRYAGKCYATK